MNVPRSPFVFPKWTNAVPVVLVAAVALAPLYVIPLLVYGVSPETVRTGYMPEQPVAYSHKLHAGELGIDCRYCHNTVEKTAMASIPPTQTCMNCHTNIYPNSEKLTPIQNSYATGEPVDWVRIHDVPDFVYFNHSAHINRGVACVSCHGRVDKMDKVYQAEPLTMGWCLDCHRNPAPNLRDPELVTDMDWQPDVDWDTYAETTGARLVEENDIQVSRLEDCSTCHR